MFTESIGHPTAPGRTATHCRGERCYDNAMCESFFATLECELLEQQRFTSQADARMAVFDFIEGWYNPHRRHQSLGQQSPTNFEKSHQHGLVAESP